MKKKCKWALVLMMAAVFAAQAGVRPVDLRAAANTAFADDVDGDRQGGWTDQGGHDLRVIRPGRLDRSGIPFEILPDAGTSGKSAIVLGGCERDYLPKTAEIAIEDADDASMFYLLHAGAWCPANNDILAVLTLKYEDGTKEAMNLRGGRDLVDWCQAKSGGNAVRHWTAYNGSTQVSLFVSKFPVKADARLTTVALESRGAVWMIAAAAVGDDVGLTPIKRDWRVTRTFDAPSLSEPLEQPQTTAPPRNIILLIGDGMGLGAQDLTSLWVHGDTRRLVMEQLPVAGLCTTHSRNSSVTDSAASGTAFACGEKVNNGALGVLPDGRRLKPITKTMREMGKSIAVITSDPLHGATPGAFFATQPARNMSAEIIADAAASGFDVLIGQAGSHGFFLENGKAPAQRNLQREMESDGCHFIVTPEAFETVPSDARVVGLIPSKTFTGDDRALGRLTRTAMERLANNPEGFFMMVESTYPDKGGHANAPDTTVMGTVHLDWAVKEAVEFAAKQGDTLVICTADHETGALVAVMGRAGKRHPVIYYGSTNHSAWPVPLYAFGPMAERFAGEIDNTEVSRTIAEIWGFRAPVFVE